MADRILGTENRPLLPRCLNQPDISLAGAVDIDMLRSFMDSLPGLDPEVDAAVELTTHGGDADIARRMALEVELARKRRKGRLLFLGKTQIYSAGISLMSAFAPEDRFLSSDAVLLIHGRRVDKRIDISGPIRASLPKLQAVCAELERGVELEEQGFRKLIEGSDVRFEEVRERALYNWYVSAPEALERRLIAAIL